MEIFETRVRLVLATWSAWLFIGQKYANHHVMMWCIMPELGMNADERGGPRISYRWRSQVSFCGAAVALEEWRGDVAKHTQLRRGCTQILVHCDP